MPGIWTEERRRKHSLRTKQLVAEGLYKKACNRPEVSAANRERAIARNKNENFRRRHRQACLAAMHTEEYRENYLAGIAGLVKKYGYKFTGDGQVLIAGHCPDFVNETDKEIIELNGVYWHKSKEKDKQRAKDYYDNGYRVLILYVEMIDRKDKEFVQRTVEKFRSRYSPICMATCS